MRLSLRRNRSQVTPPANNLSAYGLPPELTPKSNRRPVWLNWVALAIIVIIAVGLIVWGVIALVSNSGTSSKTVSKPRPSTSQTAPKGSTKTTPPSNSNNSSSSTSSSTGANGTSAGQSGTTNSGASSSQSGLSNTGPGDTLALFAVVVLLGFGAHQITLRRRA